MKQARRGAFTAKGLSISLSFFLFALILWIIGYFALPNKNTHRDLAANPPIESSAQTTSTGGNAAASGSNAFYSLGSGNTLNLALESGSSTANSGLNFNGYYNGQLVITVPTGWKISITYKNTESMMPHSLGVTDWADHSGGSGSFKPAFTGSIPSDFTQGITKSSAPTTISFVANKSGKYGIVCGIPGHAAGGMWDELDVSSSVKAPTIKTPSGVVTVH